MLFRLMVLFVTIPLIEIALLVKLGEVMGFWPTIWLVILTGILGASLARQQGLTAYRKIQIDLAEGRLPASNILDGIMILIAGIVLLTPGILTDSIGFLLLIPFVRNRIKDYLRTHFHHITGSNQLGEFYDEIDSSSSGIH